MTTDFISGDEKRLHALYRLSVELSALQPLDSVLEIALRHCLDLTDSQFGFVGLIAESGVALDVVAVLGFNADASFYEHFHLIPLRPNIFARVVLENRSVRSEDARYDPQRVGQPKGHPSVVTFLGVPLRHRDKPIGMIGVANRPQPYADADEHLLMTYATQIAIVISNAQLYEELTATKNTLEQKVLERTQALQEAQDALRQKASQLQDLYQETISIQEKERQRIAQDMHDGINQLLIGSMLELKSARARIESGQPRKANDALDSVQNILRDVEAEIKRVIHDLRPPSLDALGFVPALRRYIQEFRKYANLDCELRVDGRVTRLSEGIEVTVYRILQEALQNVYSHAKAQSIEVFIKFVDDELRLIVKDDGIGFDLEAIEARDRHFGLISMRERAKSLNACLKIESIAGEGTQISLCIPLQNMEQES